ncbi:MAG: SDR family oxidoreductase [Candidatus Thiodiazotropha sp. (ex Epidulcina cf. delphinae)]|nr:SDR family oxidoreductase [Candidatus Thiodiazotropha sp. (ex Epidulcina cf. delphinae)]
MKLEGARILLTGAAGGIGMEVARTLSAGGASLALLGRDRERLEGLADSLRKDSRQVLTQAVDLLDAEARNAAVAHVNEQFGGVDVLINNAGMASFRPFTEEQPEVIEQIHQLNTLVPMQLTRQLLPDMIRRGSGRIVNVGSTFGSIAFAWFAAYSASKFALRGFSEALRRELQGTGVDVAYIAPRAVRTRFNTSAVYRMAEAVKMNMDEPDWVAKRIADSIRKDRKEVYLGFPESLFVRVNALLPRLVDGAMRKQNAKMMEFAKQGGRP